MIVFAGSAALQAALLPGNIAYARPKAGTPADTFPTSIHRRLSSSLPIGWQMACRPKGLNG